MSEVWGKVGQLGALLAALLLVSMVFVPAVSAQGNENISKDKRLEEILKQLPPNPNRPEPKYLIDAEEMALVDELEKKMTEEEAKQIVSNIPELKPGEKLLLTPEQRAAAQKIMNKEASKLDRKPPSPLACSSSSVESVLTATSTCYSSTDYYRHAMIATNNKYAGANNIMSGYLPILTNATHHTLMALWFVDRGTNQWAELGMQRATYRTTNNIYTYLYDSDEGGYRLYKTVGSGTQVYFEIIVLSGNKYIAWIDDTIIDLGLHVTTTYNEVDMGGEQYDSNKYFAIGDIGNVYNPQLLQNTGYIYWGSSVPSNLNSVWCPMRMDVWDTSQGYRVHVYSQN
ncbi:MAG: hypothetical protein WA102_05265 [Candidatus Methanoperedens sp.]